MSLQYIFSLLVFSLFLVSQKSPTAQSPQQIIIINRGVQLKCESTSMKLTIDSLYAPSLQWNHLTPLKENCSGFSMNELNGTFVYTIPLADCGAEVQVNGNTFWVLLLYSSIGVME